MPLTAVLSWIARRRPYRRRSYRNAAAIVAPVNAVLFSRTIDETGIGRGNVAKIVIIGGGVVGSSIAYYLAQAGNAGDVVVIEPDPTYEFAATPRATGGIRQLYTVPENIRMSQYGHEIYGQFETLMAVDGEPARIDFHRAGFLWLGSGKKRHRCTDGELAGADRVRRPGRTRRLP